MQHKSLTASTLTIVFAFAIMYGSSRLTSVEGMESLEIMEELSGMVSDMLGRFYPLAVLLGTAIVNGEIGRCLMYTGLFLSVFAAAAAVVSACFQSICRNLYTTAARHDYQMGAVIAPFLLAGTFCMMTTAATSVSMEGKEWWLVKSLPLTARVVLDAKILMNLILILPFYLVSEVFLTLALKPGLQDSFWMMVIPAVILLFDIMQCCCLKRKNKFGKMRYKQRMMKTLKQVCFGVFSFLKHKRG
ncbi:MAG: hypothetical protein K1W22_14950 [Lachnospiraceae bacterium]